LGKAQDLQAVREGRRESRARVEPPGVELGQVDDEGDRWLSLAPSQTADRVDQPRVAQLIEFVHNKRMVSHEDVTRGPLETVDNPNSMRARPRGVGREVALADRWLGRGIVSG